MNPETIDKLKDVFTPMAEKIGQGAEFGWEVVVRQQYVEGVTSLVIAGIMLLILIIVSLLVYRFREVIIEETGGAGFVFLILLIFPTMIGSINLTSGLKHLLNPGFYAIEFFMNLVK